MMDLSTAVLGRLEAFEFSCTIPDNLGLCSSLRMRVQFKKTHKTAYKLVEILELMFAFIKETERPLPLAKLWKHSLDIICSGILLIFC